MGCKTAMRSYGIIPVDYTTDPNAGGLVKPRIRLRLSITDEDGNVITVGGKVEYDSTTGILTITPDQGYEIKDVIINGVSKGPVATVEGLTKDDDVKVVFGKIQEEADPTQSIIDGVKATTIKLKTTKAGKGYIKMEWTKSKGYKVDYYQVFRSTKRYEGYGKKPFFVKETSNLKSTYKNNKMLKKGTRYYYKVRGVRVIDGKKYYTQWSNKGWRIAK